MGFYSLLQCSAMDLVQWHCSSRPKQSKPITSKSNYPLRPVKMSRRGRAAPMPLKNGQGGWSFNLDYNFKGIKSLPHEIEIGVVMLSHARILAPRKHLGNALIRHQFVTQPLLGISRATRRSGACDRDRRQLYPPFTAGLAFA